jgi:thiaminase/transcriptional activator TenA
VGDVGRSGAVGEALSSELWSGIDDVYGPILEHPFVAGLTDGSLPGETFRFYVIQDALYLRDYARALSFCAARSPSESEIAMFNHHAAGAIEVERSLHEGFFRDLDVSDQELASTPMTPTNLAYTSYLLAVAHSGSFSEALGAVLPCYWIYWEVGKELADRGSPHELYRRWIETYGGEEFAEIVRAVLDLTDRLGPELSEVEQRRMAERFNVTSRYEWMFWDSAWRREEWPV